MKKKKGRGKMEKKIEPRTLPGFMELLPKEQIAFNQMRQAIQKSYEKFGFLPLDTPIIEKAEVLLAKAGGETEKQIYRFEKGDNDLALRFDLTVPLAKYVTQYYNDLSFPFRRYQIGKVYRGERPQKGRFREFYQCDIDIIGDGDLSIIYDAEMPAVIYQTIQSLGFEDFTICMNNRKILNGLFEALGLKEQSVEIMRIIDKIEKIGKDNVVAMLEEMQIVKEAIEKIVDFLEIAGTTDEKIQALENMDIQSELFQAGVEELKTVVDYVRKFGVPDTHFKVELTIARGLDYYTGTVYETFLNEYRTLGSVCSGGRYDNLAEYYTDKKMPGVGVSIGLTRLFYQLNELQAIKQEQKSIAKVLVIPMTENIEKALEIGASLRKENISTEIYLEEKKIKAKMKYANHLEIPYVILVGEDEINNNVVTLKNMVTGEQETVSLAEAISRLKD